MAFDISALYGGLLGLMAAVLALRIPSSRRRTSTSLGLGDDPELQTRVRVFGNFIEYAPLVLIMLVLLEARDSPTWALHTLGLAFLFARTIHTLGLSATDFRTWRFRGRFYGMIITFSVVIIQALWLVIGSLLAL